MHSSTQKELTTFFISIRSE